MAEDEEHGEDRKAEVVEGDAVVEVQDGQDVATFEHHHAVVAAVGLEVDEEEVQHLPE